MKLINHTKEHGQSLIIVAMIMIVLLAILALVLDGGNVFAKRRAAQNAADAGALAGARTLCVFKEQPGVVTMAENIAREYAVVRNEATYATPVANLDRGTMVVTTTIPVDTFFAHFVGFDQIPVQASAAAECCPATIAEGVLPIAWACQRPPIGSEEPLDTCIENIIPSVGNEPGTLPYYLQHPTDPDGVPPPNPSIWPELYVIMNSNAQPDDLSAYCDSVEGGWIPCDLDGDGDDDLVAHGDRSWLDLNGAGGGASELIDWIGGTFPGTLRTHTWFGGESGVETSVFQAVGDVVGSTVLVPVFNAFCDDIPSAKPSCIDLAHPPDPDEWPGGDLIVGTAGGNYYYHVITFAFFYITCVDAPGVPGSCPGHDAAVSIGAIANNTKTIEGYFVDGVDPDAGGRNCDVDFSAGVNSLGLIK